MSRSAGAPEAMTPRIRTLVDDAREHQPPNDEPEDQDVGGTVRRKSPCYEAETNGGPDVNYPARLRGRASARASRSSPSTASARVLAVDASSANPWATSATSVPVIARLRVRTAESNRSHSSRGPRRPVPGRSSYGGSDVSAPGIARHARPARAASSQATRSSSAAFASIRSRDANAASGGAIRCAVNASAHAVFAISRRLAARAAGSEDPALILAH